MTNMLSLPRWKRRGIIRDYLQGDKVVVILDAYKLSTTNLYSVLDFYGVMRRKINFRLVKKEAGNGHRE